MNEAASVLKLKDDFTADELREALELAVKRANDADADMAATRNRASDEIGAMQAEVKKTEKLRANAEAERDEGLNAKAAAEQALAIGRQDNAEALKKARKAVDEKQKELKAINTALADTPDNILKKLKTLKKQKKENKEQKAELETLNSLKEQTATLLANYRELATWAEEHGAEGEKPPMAEAKLLSDIETVTAGADEEEDTREAATA